MNERLFFLAYRQLPSFLIGAAIIIASYFLLVFVQGCIKTASSQGPNTNSSVYYSNNPNALAAGADEALHVLGQGLGRAWQVTKGGLLHVGSSAAATGKFVASGAQTVAIAIGRGFMAVISTAANAIVFVFQIPINVYGAISNTQAVNVVINPAEHSHNDDVPIIDPNDPALIAAKKALPAVAPPDTAAANAPQEAVWPMHGQITTFFGEKGRYYHPVHTGIDISDGQPSGVTPIRPFRSGKVILATRNSGLGNHVIVDHGSGITSVYAHMSSIAVKPGQDVDTNSVLGRQGSTGVSTGPHLHFEIRVNDQATDPRGFIAGNP
jgi:hypothetical protein